ncbi:MAG: substrate-binding domain-containing protein [Chloroflexota bacterium]
MKETVLLSRSKDRAHEWLFMFLLLGTSIFFYACSVEPSQNVKVPVTAHVPENSANISNDFVARAKYQVEQAITPAVVWDGPTSGPFAQQNKLIVYVASDLSNGSVLEVSQGVLAAGEAIGWEIRVLDGQGTAPGRRMAFEAAISQQPHGIIMSGYNAQEHADLLESANAQGIVLVGWHVANNPGPMTDLPIFANVTSSLEDMAEIAALFAISDSEGEGGIIIFTDLNHDQAFAKTKLVKEIIDACEGCNILAIEDVSATSSTAQMSARITELSNKYGSSWDYSLGINDQFIESNLQSIHLAFDATGHEPKNLFVGDITLSSYERLQEYVGQAGMMPEPLRLHGWQIVDELNRAFAGESWSGYVTPVHLVMSSNRNPSSGTFTAYDPQNGYQEAYKKIWSGEALVEAN